MATNGNQTELEALKAKCDELEDKNKIQAAAVKASMELGAMAVASKSTMSGAVFEQTFRACVNPGEKITDGKKAMVMEILGLSKREYNAYVKAFTKANPRFDRKSAAYADGGRKQPTQEPRKMLLNKLKGNTLKAPKGRATKVRNVLVATHELVHEGLKRSDKRMGHSEVHRYTMGTLLACASPNAKVAKGAFNGAGKKRKRNDTP